MDTEIERLFDLFRTSVLQNLDFFSIRSQIVEDLLTASNSYCNQCGYCCIDYCQNRTQKGETVDCLLHDENYPNGKQIPEVDDIMCLLDPTKFVKPLSCHTYGPHIPFMSFLGYLIEGNHDQAFEILKNWKCVGPMFADYLAYNMENAQSDLIPV